METDCAKCKCWIRPFEPPEGCFNCCAGQILRYAKPFELEEFFKVPPKLAEKLFEISANDKLATLTEYRNYLSLEEYNSLADKFKNITTEGWRWLQMTFGQAVEENQPMHA